MDRAVTFKQEEISGRVPQPGLDTKTDRLTARQSQCDFDLRQIDMIRSAKPVLTEDLCIVQKEGFSVTCYKCDTYT
jgi:hypothetical protein